MFLKEQIKDIIITGGLERPGGVNRKQIDVPAEVAVDQPEGWKESKKRKGEGAKPVTKGVAGFANLKQRWQPLEDGRWGRVVGREGAER